MPTVKFDYSSMKNINFHGVIDSGVDREDWDDMSDAERREIENEVMVRLVDLRPIED